MFQLLEAVQSVHKAVQSNNRDDQELQPPVPPYPDVSSLRIDEGNVLIHDLICYSTKVADFLRPHGL